MTRSDLWRVKSALASGYFMMCNKCNNGDLFKPAADLQALLVCICFMDRIKTLMLRVRVLSECNCSVFHLRLPQRHHETHQSPEAELEMEGGEEGGGGRREGGKRCRMPTL